MAMIFVILIMPKAGAKHELLINTLAQGASLLNKSSCSAPVIGVTKLIIDTDLTLPTLLKYLSPSVHQTHNN